MKFNVFGTQIVIEYSFLLVVAVSILLDNNDIFFVILFSALHEIGHLIALVLFRKKPQKIIISYYGIALRHNATLTTIKEIIFLFGGLAVNLLFVLFNVERDINFSLLIINALPIYPLDGGRIVKLILNFVFSLNLSDKIYYAISAITVVLLLGVSVFTNNISLIAISVYSLFFAVNNTVD